MASLLALAACDSLSQMGDEFRELAEGLRRDQNETSLGFLGGVVADEPLAAVAGRDVLMAGGNAVDAATAMYFNLAVTLPSTAGLGGGGVCIVHDAQTNVTRVLEFLPKAPDNPAAADRRANAVPGNLAGFHALHARYGRLPWKQLVAPAEGLARFGVKTSRAFSRDLDQVGPALLNEAGPGRVFSRPGGGLLREGDKWVQPGLAETLTRIREQGMAALYRSPGVERFVQETGLGGGALQVGEMTSYKPVWRQPVTVGLGDISVHFSPPPAAGGAVAAEMLAMMLHGQRFSDAGLDERPHLFVETAVRAYADRSRWLRPGGDSSLKGEEHVAPARMASLMGSYRRDVHIPAGSLNPKPVETPEAPSAATLAAMDEDGAGIACALTMNGLFGNGVIAGNSGVLMAAPPGRGGRGPLPLGPMLAVDHLTNDFFFAGAASGGVTAPTALMSVAMETAVNVETLEAAMDAKRLHHGGAPDIVYYEQGYDEAAIQALIGKGHRVAATPSLGRVNAVGCTQGLPYDPSSCEAVSDPRGFGLGIKVDD